MTVAMVMNLLIALVGVLAGVFGSWLTRPKVVAEATKARAEATLATAEGTALDWERFQLRDRPQSGSPRLLRQDAEIENLQA
jgi:hypothetical protein